MAYIGRTRLPWWGRSGCRSSTAVRPRGYNKANARVAVETTGQQVFQPGRDDFDDLISRFFLYDLGIPLLALQSNGPPPANLEERANTLITGPPRSASPTVNRAREVLSQFFGRDLERIRSPWPDLPMSVGEHCKAAGRAPYRSCGRSTQQRDNVDGQAAEQRPVKAGTPARGGRPILSQAGAERVVQRVSARGDREAPEKRGKASGACAGPIESREPPGGGQARGGA